MPCDFTPISVAGSRLATTTTFLPTRSAGASAGRSPATIVRVLAAERDRELQQLLGLRHGLGREDLGHAQLDLAESSIAMRCAVAAGPSSGARRGALAAASCPRTGERGRRASAPTCAGRQTAPAPRPGAAAPVKPDGGADLGRGRWGGTARGRSRGSAAPRPACTARGPGAARSPAAWRAPRAGVAST